MNKNRVKITESQLNKVIKESVKRVLKEYNDPNNNGNTQTPFNELYTIQTYTGRAMQALEMGDIDEYNWSLNFIKEKINNLQPLQ